MSEPQQFYPSNNSDDPALNEAEQRLHHFWDMRAADDQMGPLMEDNGRLMVHRLEQELILIEACGKAAAEAYDWEAFENWAEAHREVKWELEHYQAAPLV
jgi:hypothetical protein